MLVSATQQHEPAVYRCTCPPSEPPFPVLCSGIALAVCSATHARVYMPVLPPLFVPPSPSPAVSTTFRTERRTFVRISRYCSVPQPQSPFLYPGPAPATSQPHPSPLSPAAQALPVSLHRLTTHLLLDTPQLVPAGATRLKPLFSRTVLQGFP